MRRQYVGDFGLFVQQRGLALAVCGGVFPVTTPVVTIGVPIASVASMSARKRSTATPLGGSGP